MQCHQVDRKGEKSVIGTHYPAVAVVVELGKPIDKRPHFGVVSVKNVRSVLVHLNAMVFLAVAVATDVAAAVDQEYCLASIGHAAGEDASE